MNIATWIKLHPAVITGAVAALINMALAVGVNLSQDQVAAIGTITTALMTIIVTAATRPVGLQLIIGAATTIVGALAAFHFTVSPSLVSASATLASLVLGALFHLAHVPVKAFRQGTDALALDRKAALNVAR